jgi:hypothetical protein
MEENIIEKFQKEDINYLQKRNKLVEDLGFPYLYDLIDHFGLYIGVQTLGRALAVYEIMKQTLHLPGHIAEFGCYKGANLLLMAKILKLLQPNTYKHIYGFDSFEGLKDFSSEDKGLGSIGAYKGEIDLLLKMIDFFDMREYVHIVKGNVLETIPQFEKDNPHIMFSLIYIDLDLYEPTLIALDFASRKIVPGGCIVLDEAFTNYWPGEGKAFIEHLSNYGFDKYIMRNIPFARQPTVYLIKK